MTGRIFEPIRENLKIFLVTAAAISIASVAAISIYPTRVAVKSSIRVATALSSNRWEALIPIDQISKLTSDLYLSKVLVNLASQGASDASLRQFQDLKVGSIGQSISLQNIVSAGDEDRFKKFQTLILDQIVLDQVGFSENARATIHLTVQSAIRIVENLTQRIDRAIRELKELDHRSKALQELVSASRSQIDEALKAVGYSKDMQALFARETDIREARDAVMNREVDQRRIDEERGRLNREISDLQQAREGQLKLKAASEQELLFVCDPSVLLEPSTIPINIGPRRLFLVIAAIIASLAAAYLIVIMIRRTRLPT
ncbi:hypothetical protein [Bradyrhizobium sp. CCGUVB23]|uniref:hypothetical protein n=1 Tax=Bradyrhizobium sp. CCGUVB23 TaxID=2949630 RepID=UPI0020B2508A|nr:hypothetical protein [Bradyrhizobium sp. CCGUVB23]MCP3461776.1 hypothetical protein [Bradyrhizobium sp. CCGUVB23]